MLWIPPEPTLVETNAGGVGSVNFGTSVTTGSTSSTKGSWAQLIASTSFDASLVYVVVHGYRSAAALSDLSVDIGIGASGSEQVLIADLLAGGAALTGSGDTGPREWFFPLYIPAGSRLSARAAGDRTSTALRVAIWLYGGNSLPAFPIGTKVVTYGMGTVPDGTAVTPGNAVEGSWTQITASTSENHFALIPSFQVNNDTTQTNGVLNIDIGIGGAGSEVQVGSWFAINNVNESMGSMFPPLPAFVHVPAGTRLAMRASFSTTPDAGYTGVIHAIS
jgi:hypothetical protein